MPKRDPARDEAKLVLEKLGYGAKEIPESEERRADLRATKGTWSCLLEVKSRVEDQELGKSVAAAELGEIVNYVGSLAKANVLSSIVKDAQNQLFRTPRNEDEPLGLWFQAERTLGMEEACLRMKNTLLGIRHSFVDKPDGTNVTMPIHFAGFADFFRYRELDFAVMVDADGESRGLELLVNPFSVRAGKMRISPLYADLQPAIIDPEADEAQGRAYVLDSSVDRGDEPAIRAYLSAKYGVKVLALVDLSTIGGVVNVT